MLISQRAHVQTGGEVNPHVLQRGMSISKAALLSWIWIIPHSPALSQSLRQVIEGVEVKGEGRERERESTAGGVLSSVPIPISTHGPLSLTRSDPSTQSHQSVLSTAGCDSLKQRENINQMLVSPP